MVRAPRRQSEKKKDWRFSYLIVCDDIRVEISGKEILIGVYAGNIVMPQFPAMVQSLFVRVVIEIDRPDFESVGFEIRNPDGTIMTQTTGSIQASFKAGEEAKFVFGLGPVMFSVQGVYIIYFGMNGELERVGKITVRGPTSDQERQKLAGVGASSA